jgi:transposase-like protein
VFPKVTLDKSEKAAMDEINGRGETLIIVRQVKYLNNICGTGPSGNQTRHRPMLNFQSFPGHQSWLASVELMHMISERLAHAARLRLSLRQFMRWQGEKSRPV